MYIPQYFQLYELVPPGLYADKSERFLWHLFDDRILIAADGLRRRYGKLIVNTWRWGGRHMYRGFRPPGTTVGSPWSQHRWGRGIDFMPTELSAEEIRDDLKNNYSRGKDPLDGRKYISRVENGVSWLHCDCANYGNSDEIYFFNP